MTAETKEETKQNRVAIAIDPGRAKCGLAVVREDGAVLFRAIISAAQIAEEAARQCSVFAPFVLIIGNGTGSAPILAALQAAILPAPIVSVNESHTSEAARKRFIIENRPVGWQKLLPPSLRTPPVPYDDYVAVILAERYFDEIKGKG